jgi:hypothetical protein
VCPPGGAVADFLTAAPVHTERIVKPGFDGQVPNTAEEFESRYYQSMTWQTMQQDMTDPRSLDDEIYDLKTAIALERQRSPLLRKIQSVYTVDLMQQIWACTIR